MVTSLTKAKAPMAAIMEKRCSVRADSRRTACVLQLGMIGVREFGECGCHFFGPKPPLNKVQKYLIFLFPFTFEELKEIYSRLVIELFLTDNLIN